MESKEDMKEQLMNNIRELFEKNGEKSIEFIVNSDPAISVKMQHFSFESGEELFKLWLMDGGEEAAFWNVQNLSDVASKILEAPAYIASRRKNISELKKYWNQYIKGHTQEQWDLAKRVMWKNDFGQNLNERAISLQIPLRVAEDALIFASYIDKYKDAHHEIFGRNILADEYGKTEEENDNNVFGGIYSSNYDEEFLNEHPDAMIRDRKEIYVEFDNTMHRVDVQNVPGSLVNYPGEDSKRSYAVLYHPNICFFENDSGLYYTLDANRPYFRLELPLAQVQQREDGNFDLILDDREEYGLGSGAKRKALLTHALAIQSAIKQYMTKCDLSVGFPHPSVYLHVINRKNIRKLKTQDKSIVCVKVPYPKSSDGFGMIYRDNNCVVIRDGINLKLGDICTVHYYVTDTDGHKVRKHDKGVNSEDIKAVAEQFQENMKSSSEQAGGYITDVSADLNNEELIKNDLENDELINHDQWLH